jgi:hypothetical protein
VEIAGRLNSLLGEEACPNLVKGVWGKMVGGALPPFHTTQIRDISSDCPSKAPKLSEVGSIAEAQPPRSKFADGGHLKWTVHSEAKQNDNPGAQRSLSIPHLHV